MRGRRGVVAALVLAVGVGVAGLVGVVAGAAGSSDGSALKAWGFPSGLVGGGVVPHITNARQLVLLGRNFTATNVDNPPVGTSQGDELAVEGQLFTFHGAPAGRLEVHETLTGIGPGPGSRLLITFTARLSHGQIAAIGVAGAQHQNRINVAVVGGTGRYRNARGEVVVTAGPNNLPRFTFLLLP
jgi:hypothetical protein